MKPNSSPNRLIHSASPYLQQHAYNPVDWYPWGEEALQRAKTEDKPLLLSIGYSTCHWCHVMEAESFGNETVATLMNQHFVCIKVDREERPDIDTVYMDAVSALGQRGGWPLNVLLTPEGKPFYGGSYFPPEEWIALLANVADVFQTRRQELEDSAEELAKAIQSSEVQKYQLFPAAVQTYKPEVLREIFQKLAEDFDPEYGGLRQAPKFPTPTLYWFLMYYYEATQDPMARHHLLLSLERMAKGGIYDPVAGGFTRYSVDASWFLPHFEKMLYDSAQLLGLYARAYTLEPSPLFAQVVTDTADFLLRELQAPQGGFYTAVDAAIDGVEGKYYCWTYAELQALFSEADLAQLAAYYELRPEGNWEEGKNILYSKVDDEAFAQAHRLSPEGLQEVKTFWHHTLRQARSQRPRPHTDQKQLCAWNALAITGLLTAYRVFGQERWLEAALSCAQMIEQTLRSPKGTLYRSPKSDNGPAIEAYLEDYAALIEAYTALYQTTFDSSWLAKAEALVRGAQTHFWDETEGLFFFTAAHAAQLIARKKEIFDGVMPASNSAMALNLHRLGLLLDKPQWRKQAADMLSLVSPQLSTNAEYLSNWACLYAMLAVPTAEVAMVVADPQTASRQLDRQFVLNYLVAAKTPDAPSALPLLHQRQALNGQDTYYVCFEQACQLPVHTLEAVLTQIQKRN
ncbi:thioredoxin domain-containing protein [Eisenibacter elegans]|uniref:thioredoxin domain-containing protein n=1 Tax=Eisenibacter elegans TaxID=997 RepID=UPI00040378FB|nr:thioredoxin domain-containing protein [Eisenibacter elegans]